MTKKLKKAQARDMYVFVIPRSPKGPR